MKRLFSFAVLLTLLCCHPVLAADSTGAPEGTAKQSDQDLKGASLSNVGDLDATQVTADSVQAAGNISGGSVTTPGEVSAGVVSAPAGAITTLNSNKVYIQSTPSNGVDATNKSYVDGQDSALQSQLSNLQSQVSSLSGGSDSPFVQPLSVNTGLNGNTWITCPSGYSGIVIQISASWNNDYNRLATCSKVGNPFVSIIKWNNSGS